MNNKPAQIYLIPSTIASGTQDLLINKQIHQVISRVDYYLVENIRSARRFISSLKIRDVSDIEFRLYNKDTNDVQFSELLIPVLRGNSAGIISEAGCPGVADPGSSVVRWAHGHKIRVVPLTGPSSIILALMGSGMNGQHFEFHGYLPIEKQQRAKRIKYLEQESAKTGKCQIFMETPYRNVTLANSLIEQCQGNTSICFATDLTSGDEIIITKTVAQWKGQIPDIHKKPTIFLIQAKSNHF